MYGLDDISEFNRVTLYRDNADPILNYIIIANYRE